MVLWVVVGIDPTLSAVEARGGIHSVRPSLRFRVVQPPPDQAVVGTAGQGEFIDVGFPVVGDPAVDVVDLTPVGRCGAARAGAAPLERVQHDALPRSCEAFRAATVQRFAGVFVIDHQVVMRLCRQPDHIAHRQQRATGGDCDTRRGLQVLQRRGHDDRGCKGNALKQDPTDVVAATLGTDGANPAAGDALARANGLPWSAGRCQNSLVINVPAVAVCKRVGQQAQRGIVRGNSYLCPCP